MTGCGGEASLPVYSNLSEEQVREQFETELIQAGAAETDAQKSMAIVKEYNDSIQNTSLVEEGYASFDMTMPEYEDLRKELELDASSKVLCFSTEGDTDPERYKTLCGTVKIVRRH